MGRTSKLVGFLNLSGPELLKRVPPRLERSNLPRMEACSATRTDTPSTNGDYSAQRADILSTGGELL